MFELPFETKLQKDFVKHHIKIIIIGFFIALLLAIFAVIFEDIWEKDPRFIIFDKSIWDFIQTIRTPFLNGYFLKVTLLGNTLYAGIVAVISFITLILLKRFRFAAIFMASLIGDAVIVTFIKELVKRGRPEIASALITETDFSFPSGHAFTSICLYGLLFYFIFISTKNKAIKILTAISSLILVLSIGFSRIYLGVHWTTDVVASYVLSTALVLSILTVSEKLRSK